jgi:hypothetical protein
VNPRPEIVLPPGFALRIDYDPASSPASLVITAYRDDAPVGQAHLDPREVGHRLRLEVEGDGAMFNGHQPRLRLTPQRATRAIEMGAVLAPAPQREPLPAIEQQVEESRELPPDVVVSAAELRLAEPPAHAAMDALRELAREGAFDDVSDRDEERPWTRVQRALRAFSAVAVDVLGNPLRLRDADAAGWPSWRASWRGAHQPSGAGES